MSLPLKGGTELSVKSAEAMTSCAWRGDCCMPRPAFWAREAGDQANCRSRAAGAPSRLCQHTRCSRIRVTAPHPAGLHHGARHQQSHSHRQSGRGSRDPCHALGHHGREPARGDQRKLARQADRRAAGAHGVAPRRALRPPGGDRRRVPEKGLAGLHRGEPAHAQVAGQAGQRALLDRNHRQRTADARRPRRWRRRRRCRRRAWRRSTAYAEESGGGGGGGRARRHLRVARSSTTTSRSSALRAISGPPSPSWRPRSALRRSLPARARHPVS